MLETLKSIVRSALFREILRVVLAALAGYSASGCAALGLGATYSPSISVLACKADVLRPYVDAAAEEVVRSIDGNRAFDVYAFFQSQGLSIPEILRIADAYSACVPEPEPITSPEPITDSLTRT